MPPKRKLTPDVPPPAPAAITLPLILADEAAFARALDALHGLDAVLSAALRASNCEPRLRRREPGFRGLAAIIVSQQVSTASAAAIFGRLDVRFPGLDGASVLAASDEELRACGLSAGKARALRAIATAERDGLLDFAALERMGAGEAHAALCAIKGVGPWTADVFLLFCLGHADAWPAGDLAVQEGARLVLGLAVRPDAKALGQLGERWRPLRGVAAHCLWAYYGAARARSAVPVAGTEPVASPPSPVVAPPPRRQKRGAS